MRDQWISLFRGKRLWIVLALALWVVVDLVPDGELDTADAVIDVLYGLVTADVEDAEDAPAFEDVTEPLDETPPVDETPVDEPSFPLTPGSVEEPVEQ